MVKLAVIILCLILSGCSANYIERKIIGKYYLAAHEASEQMSLCYAGGSSFIVENCVFSAGHNDKYIILKQHPYYWARFKNMPDSIQFPQKHPDKKIIYYYIVPIQEPINWDMIYNIVIPLNQEQFDQKRKELGIEDIQFTIVYKDLE